jgi:hypothetical protein
VPDKRDKRVIETEMSNKYDDIINLPYPKKSSRPRMSMHDRAAQFSPFAALVGYEDAVEETARYTDEMVELAEDAKAIIDANLTVIADKIKLHPAVTITFFVPDEKKSGGKYVTVTDKVKSIDEIERALCLVENGTIAIDNIRELELNV